MRQGVGRIAILAASGLALVMLEPPAAAQSSCNYYREQAAHHRAQIKSCDHGLSAAQKQSCIRTFTNAANNYDEQYRDCQARKARAAAQSGSSGGTGYGTNSNAAAAAQGLIDVFNKYQQDKAAREADEAAARQEAERQRELAEENRRLREEMAEIQRQQRLQALKAELADIYQRRGVWAPDNDPKTECSPLAWAMTPARCEKGGAKTPPKPHNTVDDPPKVTTGGCSDGLDFVEFSCHTPVPESHHGCRTVTPPASANSSCSHRWGCCLTAEDRLRIVGEPAPVDRCTYDPWGPSRTATLKESTPPAPLWTSGQCRAIVDSAQAELNEMRRRHEADSNALLAAKSATQPPPEHHCCSDRHVQTLVDLATKLHGQLKTVKEKLAAEGTAAGRACADILRQPEIDLGNVTSKIEWDLGLISTDPKPAMTSGPYQAISNFDVGTNAFTSLCVALTEYEACTAKRKRR